MRADPRGKRALDVAAAAVLLAVAAPLYLAVAVTVAVALGRPVHFTQWRPGRGARPFRLVKFRTMRPVAPGRESDADRLTPCGRWLRRCSLDELPTLWNVLRGDMSLVGPRPLLTAYLDRYTPAQARRHEVRPGVTGLAQVRGRNDIAWSRRLALDTWYVEHRSLRLDLRILAATATAVWRGTGVAAPGEATMAEFRGTAGAAPAQAGR
ncbi:UDP-phosphate galactose phosphotransferase [Pilimelia terevasa]|uniref:UDP-phosphate galactose phosphotransferase n=1 Tax=Pilimelia terevasa TaxID=53372 RepID=A0A8J3FJP0_9ACTN|nr:sugar transferase [Pilimelia terevasa]GGK29942.1 UDP-phosphate galactose phosphotransferase [Pilimelia terevasa]